ncbi:MAG: guanylate kinase [Oscillatoria sp. Prado101]|jgi:guanylate kinase|nr:guanylate kinase [Oscillatoria sp. Prado101]
MKTGKLIVLTGPSGVGKGTLLRALRRRHPELYLSVSVTTRSPRAGEINGRHYYFIDRHQFEQMVATGELLEWAEFAGNYYGTLRRQVETHLQEGEWVVLEIELEGARQIRRSFPQALQIFLLPPSMDALETRMRERGKDSEESMALRLQRAKEEIAAAGEFDFQIVNDNLEKALQEIEAAVFAPVNC